MHKHEPFGIETSSVVGHFSELNAAVYLDIFSCKQFDSERVSEFCKSYFQAQRVHPRFIVRE
ncbi:MAG: S-adenosylmethionine decarboxylase [Verrucomicrobia bacterium]|nr:S-adenosylmethionine decarboxylase [Verrucomicrobiota bacterium]